MHLAAGEGNFDAVRCLGEKGANFNVKDEDGVSE